MNRAKGAKAAEEGYDYYVGLEGGIEIDSDGKMWCSAWMIVSSHLTSPLIDIDCTDRGVSDENDRGLK